MSKVKNKTELLAKFDEENKALYLVADAEVIDDVTKHLKSFLIKSIKDFYESVRGEEKVGIEECEYTDDGETYTCPSCKECGGYEECDCSGHNQAIQSQDERVREWFEGEV